MINMLRRIFDSELRYTIDTMISVFVSLQLGHSVEIIIEISCTY